MLPGGSTTKAPKRLRARALSVDVRPGAMRQRGHGSAPDGAKTRGDNEQGGAHRHLHSPAGAAGTVPASWARPRRPQRGGAGAHCGIGRYTAHKSAPEGTREQWGGSCSPRRRGPPTRQSSRGVGSAESCGCAGPACAVTYERRCLSLLYSWDCLNPCDALLENEQEDPRRHALTRALSLLSFPDAQRSARALSLSLLRALCARSV